MPCGRHAPGDEHGADPFALKFVNVASFVSKNRRQQEKVRRSGFNTFLVGEWEPIGLLLRDCVSFPLLHHDKTPL